MSPTLHKTVSLSRQAVVGLLLYPRSVYTADRCLAYRRFGKDPDAPPDASGRSMLSPIPERLGLGDQEFPGPSVPDWQEDWQRWVFGGHTAAEVWASPSTQTLADADMLTLVERSWYN